MIFVILNIISIIVLFTIFLFFTFGSPSLEEAVRSALNNSETDILVNLKADRRFSFGFPLGEDTISVKADGIKLAPMFGGFDD